MASLSVIALGVVVLSPAFAQVAGAKQRDQSRDIANLLKLSTALLTYTTDNNDQFPVTFQNISGGICLPNDPTVCGYRSMWTKHVYPYFGDWKYLRANDEYKFGASPQEYLNVSYGYNYGYLSTLCIANDPYSIELGCQTRDPGSPNSTQWYRSVSRSSVVDPTDTILMTDASGREFVSGNTQGSLVNPPDAYNADKYFYGPVQMGWGANCSNYRSQANGLVRTDRFRMWDGFAPRYLGKANVAFVDGHVAALSPAEAATGTNFDPNQSCTLTVVTDPAAYKWDPRH